MRPSRPHTLLRRFAVLVLAALAMLQLSASIAATIDPCPMDDCEDMMQCMVSCTGCAPLSTAGAAVATSPDYLAETLPAAWVGKIVQGALSDIWRPPRTSA